MNASLHGMAITGNRTTGYIKRGCARLAHPLFMGLRILLVSKFLRTVVLFRFAFHVVLLEEEVVVGIFLYVKFSDTLVEERFEFFDIRLLTC